jgi:hypothetical protein
VEYVNVLEDKSRMAVMLKHSQNDRRVPVIDGGS